MLPPAAAAWVSVGQSGMEKQKTHRDRWVLAEKGGIVVAEKRDCRRLQRGSQGTVVLEWKELLAVSAGVGKSSWTRTEFVRVSLSTLSAGLIMKGNVNHERRK